MSAGSPHVLWFEKGGRGDVGSGGGTNPSRGEMVARLGDQGVDSIPVRPGSFVSVKRRVFAREAIMPPEHARARG